MRAPAAARGAAESFGQANRDIPVDHPHADEHHPYADEHHPRPDSDPDSDPDSHPDSHPANRDVLAGHPRPAPIHAH